MKIKFSKYVLLFSILALFYTHFSKVYSKYPKIENPISWDVFGYYLYLPSAFIYNDIRLEKKEWLNSIYEKYKPSDTQYQIHDSKNGKRVIVYPPGYSFIYAPGFFLAHIYSLFFDNIADGFSFPYQIAIYISSFIFIVIGFIYFRKILLHFFDEFLSSVLMLLIFFATNFYFSAYYDPVMVHSYLFTLNCLILWHGIQWVKNVKPSSFYKFILFLCLASLCRPTEFFWIIIILIGNVRNWLELKQRFNFLWLNKDLLIKGGILFTLLFSIYFLYLFVSNDTPFQLNFHSEHLAFDDPYLFSYLFSFKKGWLIYTPIMIFSLIGFIIMFKNKIEYYISFNVLFVITLYVLSSWECWWYGASFGQRSMVESYVLLAIPLGYFFKSFKSLWIKIIITNIVFLFLFLNVFQVWQYRNGLIHSSRMTQSAYWSIFAKTKKSKNFESLLSVEETTKNPINSIYLKKYYNLIFNKYLNNQNIKVRNELIYKSLNKYSVISDSIAPFLFDFSYTLNKIKLSHFRAKLKARFYYKDTLNKPNFALVALVESGKRNYQYTTVESNFNNFKENKWNEIELDFFCPFIRHKSDKLKVYLWNINGKTLYIDYFNLKIYEPLSENK